MTAAKATPPSGPYLITTKSPDRSAKLAVNDLDLAKAYVSGLVSSLIPWPTNPEASHAAAAQLWPMTAEGGTVGPLPDEIEIKIEPVLIGALIYRTWAGVDPKPADWAAADLQLVVDRYNAAQAAAVAA